MRTLLNRGYLSEPGALDTFELSLSLHAASPKIETYYEFYRDHKLAEAPLVDGEVFADCTGSWVEWDGRRVCSVKTLEHLVDSSTSKGASGSVCVSGLHATKAK